MSTVFDLLRELGMCATQVSQEVGNQLLATPFESRTEQDSSVVQVKLAAGNWLSLHVVPGSLFGHRGKSMAIQPTAMDIGKAAMIDFWRKISREQLCTLLRKRHCYESARQGRGAFVIERSQTTSEIRVRWMSAFWKREPYEMIVNALKNLKDDRIALVTKIGNIHLFFEKTLDPMHKTHTTHSLVIEKEPADTIGHLCGHCFKRSRTRLERCGICRSAFYCNTTCQKADWKSHKPMCPDMLALENLRKI